MSSVDPTTFGWGLFGQDLQDFSGEEKISRQACYGANGGNSDEKYEGTRATQPSHECATSIPPPPLTAEF